MEENNKIIINVFGGNNSMNLLISSNNSKIYSNN